MCLSLHRHLLPTPRLLLLSLLSRAVVAPVGELQEATEAIIWTRILNLVIPPVLTGRRMSHMLEITAHVICVIENNKLFF